MIIISNNSVIPEGLLRDGPEGPDTDGLRLEDFFSYRLLALARLVDRQAKRSYAENFGLSLAEWRILAILALSGETTVNDLAARLGYDKSQISRAVGVLVKRGALQRSANKADQRSSILRLSDEGLALYEAALPLGRERQKELLAPLSPEQRRQLYEIFAEISANLRASEGIDAETPAPSSDAS